MLRVALGLGANLGDRLDTLGQALKRIEQLPATLVLRVSHAYESEPWGPGDQPNYANAVAIVQTPLGLPELLDALKDIERELGREPSEPEAERRSARNAPRPIDLDILLAGSEEWDTRELVVPHPRISERDFVVTPLLEVEPDARFPDDTAVTREHVRVGRVLGVLGRVPGYEDVTSQETSIPSGVRSRSAVDSGLAEEAHRPSTAGGTRTRQPLPGEEWVPVYEQALAFRFGASPVGPQHPGAPPSVQASFAQLVLEQEGIPYAWDPFPPEEGSDPYGFPRQFRIMVPASMARDAEKAIFEASRAPFRFEEP